VLVKRRVHVRQVFDEHVYSGVRTAAKLCESK